MLQRCVPVWIFMKDGKIGLLREKEIQHFLSSSKACLQVRFPASGEWLLFHFSFVLGI